tara:strand:+ start:286 stop:1911 length:1626 start_codon:yes stop_codon:yes gene_type:complete
MAKGYQFVPQAAVPEVSMADRLASVGAQMSAAQQANSQNLAERMKEARKLRNTQMSTLAAPLKNTEDWSAEDLEEFNRVIESSQDLLKTNPALYPELQRNIYNFYSQGSKHAALRKGINNAEDRYLQAMSGDLKPKVEGKQYVTSDEDLMMRTQSFDRLGEKTGEMWDDPLGIGLTLYDYYAPGSLTTMKQSIEAQAAERGVEVSYETDPSTGITYASIPGSQPQPVSGPYYGLPGRGSGRYFQLETIDISRTPVTEYIKLTTATIQNLRREVDSNKMTRSEAEDILRRNAIQYHNLPQSTGARAAAMDMWNDQYKAVQGEYDPALTEIPEGEQESEYQKRGVKTPAEVYADAYVTQASVSKTERSSSGGGSGATWDQDRRSNTSATGPTSLIQEDLAGPRAVLYEEYPQLKNIDANFKRADINIGGENMKFNSKNYGEMTAYPDLNIVLLHKKESDYMGKESALNESAETRWKNLGNSRHWDKDPEIPFEIIQIYSNPINPTEGYTEEFERLSADYYYRYRRSQGITQDALIKEIDRLTD